MSPDYGMPGYELAAECTECGSQHTTEPNRHNECKCLDCGQWFSVGPDPFDYSEYDR